jgi:multiple sugar transport system permease protein
VSDNLARTADAAATDRQVAAVPSTGAYVARHPVLRSRTWSFIARHAAALLVFVFFAFPVLWLVELSFKTDKDATALPPKLLFAPTLVQYEGLLDRVAFFDFYRNSLIVVVVALVVSISLGVPLAYSLARFHWRRKNDISFFILSQLLIPPAGVVLPFYLLCQQLGILRTLWAPILVYTVFATPFIAWMMKTFFEGLAVEIEEAGLVDGATRFQVFRLIVLPLVGGQLASTSMLAAVTLWNEFFFALVLTGASTYTAPVAITTLHTTLQVVRWGQIAAGGVLISLPIVVLGILVQRSLVSGLTFGAVK